MLKPAWQYAACRHRLNLSDSQARSRPQRHKRGTCAYLRLSAQARLAQTSPFARQPLAFACDGAQALKQSHHSREYMNIRVLMSIIRTQLRAPLHGCPTRASAHEAYSGFCALSLHTKRARTQIKIFEDIAGETGDPARVWHG
eukprot:6193402-Pleurochrysis_carterae.AAC.7